MQKFVANPCFPLGGNVSTTATAVLQRLFTPSIRRVEKVRETGAIYDVLNELGIPMIPTEQVRSFQKNLLSSTFKRKVTQEVWHQHGLLVQTCAAISLVGLGMWVVSALIGSSFVSKLGAALFSVGPFFLLYLVVMAADVWRKMQWKQYFVYDLESPASLFLMPAHVVEDVKRIRKRLNKDKVEHKTIVESFDGDPFIMFCHWNGKSWEVRYTHHWGDPEFYDR